MIRSIVVATTAALALVGCNTPVLHAASAPATASTYDRAAFGRAWIDVDKNGCNQRDDVLRRDAVAGSVKVVQEGKCDHDVVAGTWVDPYTGKTTVLADAKREANKVPIDHIVALKEAWDTGASAWDDSRRTEFANDLNNLQATTVSVNSFKSDKSVAEWQPPAAYQCTFAVRYTATKFKWQLTMTDAEKTELARMLGTC